MTSDDRLPELTGIILEQEAELTLIEISSACAVGTETIVELVEEGVLAPAGDEPQRWRFTGLHLHRATVALRLQRDLGVNPAGAALALALLEELEVLRARLRSVGEE